MELSIGLSQEQQLKVSPSLIVLNEILQLSSAELQDQIRRELEENPALEIDSEERRICPNCGGAYRGVVCQRCLGDTANSKISQNLSFEAKTTSDGYSDDYYGGAEADSWGSGGMSYSGEEEFDPLTIVAAERSLTESILADLNATLPDEDMPIAEFLIGSLDERGYLTTEIESVAQAFNCEPARVLAILKELQQIAPAGVGARNLQECLLLQYHYLKEQGVEAPYVENILKNHFEALGSHKFTLIATQLGVSGDEVTAAREFIKKNLSPFPAEGQVGELNGVRYGGSRSEHVLPDVIISEQEGEFKVEVSESRRFYLRLNPMYLSFSNQMGEAGPDASEEDREHIRRYLNRAKTFLANINQRRETMRRITEALVDIQKDFLQNGVRDLRPLTRSALASYLGLHESTVSRATAGKYVMLPNRKVISYNDFFTASLSIKDVIKEILEAEKGKGIDRLTDQVIVEKLAERNIYIARRTVAKYRNQLKILPSTLR